VRHRWLSAVLSTIDCGVVMLRGSADFTAVRSKYRNLTANVVSLCLARGLWTGSRFRPSFSINAGASFVGDLAEQADVDLGQCISPSTLWRILDTDAIKPWRYRRWTFPREPKFPEKAGRVLDLHAGSWEGSPPGRRDSIVSSDEKSGIQARIRCRDLADRPRTADAHRARIRAGSCLAVPGCLGRSSQPSLGPVSGEDRHGLVRPIGRAGHADRALSFGEPGVLGRGQRLLAPPATTPTLIQPHDPT
jgi:hypothetical protein